MGSPWDVVKVEPANDPWAVVSSTPDTSSIGGSDMIRNLAMQALKSKSAPASPSNPANAMPQQSFLDRHPYLASVPEEVGNAIVGAAKSASQTVFHPSEGQTLDTSYSMGKGLDVAPSRPITKQEYAATQPEGIAQHIGSALEQAAEMSATGGPIRGLAKEAGVGILGKMGLSAGNTAVNASLHGQDVKGAAVIGGLSEGGGQLAEKIAPKLAEAALGTRFSERMYGRNPGQAIINATSGIRPDAIARNAKEVSTQIVSRLENSANAAAEQGVTVSTKPALDILDKEIATATRENNAAAISQLAEARKQLTEWVSSGKPIPENISPSQLLDLKRGFGDTVTNWGKIPEKSGISGVMKRAYHALDAEFDRAVPGAAKDNQTVSTLIGIARDADRKALMPGIMQSITGRMLAHTGALTGGIAGGIAGYQHGGARGGVIGTLAGIAAPELLARPATVMTAARTASALSNPTFTNGILPAFVKEAFDKRKR